MRYSLFVLPVLAIVSSPVWAHHSFARYDFDKEVMVKGTVKEFQFSNPHSWVHVVAPDGETWSVEGGSTAQLVRVGWKRNTLKTGDKVTITMHPTRDPSHEGSLLDLKDINGEAFTGVVAHSNDNPVKN